MNSLSYGIICVVLVSTVNAWPNGRRGNGGRGGRQNSDESSESREDWWWRDNFPAPADTGLTEECPTILEATSGSLSLLADEMPAHYAFLIPALESIYAGDILNYPIEPDTKLFNAIGEFVLAADSIEDLNDLNERRTGGGCTKRALMVAVKKLNAAITDGLAGMRELEQALALTSVPAEVTERLNEWIGAFEQTLVLRNDLLECFATSTEEETGNGEEEDGEDMGAEGETGGEETGGEGEGNQGGEGEQVP